MKPNWKNKTIFTGDNLHVMRGMNSGSADLIYLDPPFNSNKAYAAPIGSRAAGAAFKDSWTLSDVDLVEHNRLKDENMGLYALLSSARCAHSKGMFSYLVMMAIRLAEMKRILKPTGSLYLHCDPTASHYLKLVMDAIFGRENFRNEIVWHYYNKYGAGKRIFGRNYDQIMFYSKSGKYHFNSLREKRDRPARQLVRENVGGVLKNRKDRQGNLIYRISEDKKMDAVWTLPCLQPASRERLGYPTQKPLALLDRIIKASSNEGDMVFDPFCGGATTLVAADIQGRNWIGIDISPRAVDLVVSRTKGERELLNKDVVARDDVPRRTDKGDELRGAEKTDYRKTLYGLQGGCCNGCQEHFQPQHLEMDHIIPKAKGGTDHSDNFQLLCGNCNKRKGARTQAEFKAELVKEKGVNISWL